MIAFNAIPDSVRSSVLALGVGATAACLTMVVSYLRHPSPRMPRVYVLAVALSWLTLAIALGAEIIQRWGQPLTYRWMLGLVAYSVGFWAFWLLASHVAKERRRGGKPMS